MPRGPREINDRITESRLRQVIRWILDQEVRRLNISASALQDQVDTNTVNTSINEADIEELRRRVIGNL